MINSSIEDICQRVFGKAAEVKIDLTQGVYVVRICPSKRTDPLTQSQQEMDVIMSLQHLLQGAALKLDIV